MFDRQLVELLSGLPSPVDIVGLSMGGAIAVGFINRHSEPVRKLALIDPADLPMPEGLSTKRVRAALPQATFHPIAGCGHIPHLEKPVEVNKILGHFLTA